ncbi:MAG: carbohydrate kinase [Bacteroidetes bacterium CG18_big_fil_WC_8_21_14_2_50_41_14]|nr:MAG: carbohydrate kinase [Bacteroidetes bacterium CG18_big_fil_WC_8_21_14_2_50_41_14]PJB56487.1 MAG: carbohydrate kinase [Bacteroidetes bacterium CG_4_9_14_3_um_filter_41_19]
MRKPVVIGLGEVLWDLLPGEKKLGGAPANVAFHARQLGADAVVVSAIGNDALGEEMIDVLVKKQLSHHLAKTVWPTGTVEVKLHQGNPEYNIIENVAWDHIQYTTEIEYLADTASAICFGSLAQRSLLTQQTIYKVLSRMPDQAIKLFDINIRQQYFTREILLRSLNACNMLKINHEELDLLTDLLQLPSDETEKLHVILQKFGLQLIALTKGEKGSLLYTDKEVSNVEATHIQVVDTIGAGDSFSAALIMGLINKNPLCQIHQHAARVSSFVCTQKGATPQLPVELIF